MPTESPQVHGSVSGRYEGTATATSTRLLDLRVDIDPRLPHSPVLNRLSGDLYRVFHFSSPERSPLNWRIYQESWIVDALTIQWSATEVEIGGTVRFWRNEHPATTVTVRIPWRAPTMVGPAEVIFVESSGATSSYTCAKISDYFREVALEIDICQSVDRKPLLPSYDTDFLQDRPPSVSPRTLTIEQVYAEAGIQVKIAPDHTIVDDTDPEFSRWTDAELHDAMETHFNQLQGSWPKWQMWGLLAGTYDDRTDKVSGGVMFDGGVNAGGPGRPPERQGFAIFRNHNWFSDLVEGAPANPAQAKAMRQFLYTWVHEAGHAFNFVHSWNKGRPHAFSWMNYPQMVTGFWQGFEFMFEQEELLHLRHGDRAAVIMGGDPWTSGRHLQSTDEALIELEGNAPVELLIRSSGYFDLMEMVTAEIRLRNLLPDLPLTLPTALNPEYGQVTIYIRRPDGQILEFLPILKKQGFASEQTLHAQNTPISGADRHSENVLLSYDRQGFHFSTPGIYLVRAVYHGMDEMLIPSNVHQIQIGYPFSKEADRATQDFFAYEVGMSLYLGGSQSPFLAKGMRVLEELADRQRKSMVGIKAAITVANSAAKPFFRIQGNAMTKTHRPDYQRTLRLTQPALKHFQRVKGVQAKALNIEYHNLVRQRAQSLVQLGEVAVAQNELTLLQRDLNARAVDQVVLDEIQAYKAAIGA